MATRKVLTIPEAAKLLGISRNAAYVAARLGDIPTLRIGKRRLVVPRAAFEDLLAMRRAPRRSSKPRNSRRTSEAAPAA